MPRTAAGDAAMSRGLSGQGGGNPWLFDFYLAPGSQARLRNIGGGIARSQIAQWTMERQKQAGAMALEVATAYEDALKRMFSIHDKTGFTREHIKLRMNGLLDGQIQIPEAGGIIETGAAPHEITPQNGGVLRFEGTAGDLVFAPSVDHPGITADPWIERAEAYMGGPITGAFQKFVLKMESGISQMIRPPNEVP